MPAVLGYPRFGIQGITRSPAQRPFDGFQSALARASEDQKQLFGVDTIILAYIIMIFLAVTI